MCMCGKPTRNDEKPGYNPEIYGPKIREDETLLLDEPGRCQPQINGTGSTDYHAYHFRLFKRDRGDWRLAVRHGAGEESQEFYSHTRLGEILMNMDSDSRYLLMIALYHERRDGKTEGINQEGFKWHKAVAEKRIKTRKFRNQNTVKVWIEAPKPEAVKQ